MTLAFPKPVRRHKPPKAWKRSKPKRLGRPGSDPERLAFVRKLPCVGVLCFPGHVCWGQVEASHDRNHTGLGRKEPDSKTIPKCSQLHREWELHRGPFKGWSNEERHEWMADVIHKVNVTWDEYRARLAEARARREEQG